MNLVTFERGDLDWPSRTGMVLKSHQPSLSEAA
jgi:hypothetical protein